METLATRVKAKRNELRLSQAALAELVGVAQQAIQKVEAGKTRDPRFIVALAAALETTPEQLSGFSASHNKDQQIPVNLLRVEGVSRAGRFEDISLVEDDEYDRHTIPVPINPRYRHAHQYALKVAGDSMNKRFEDGCYVACASWGELGKELKPGVVLHVERIKAACMIETTIKVYAERDGKKWLDPDSTNSKHMPIEINGDPDTEIHIKGAVIGSYVEYEI